MSLKISWRLGCVFDAQRVLPFHVLARVKCVDVVAKADTERSGEELANNTKVDRGPAQNTV